MLEEIRISSLGVIEQAAAEFAPGLTVLTGETGAGKTMVVTSLHLLAGARADPGRIRAGADKAIVEGRFSLTGASSADLVRETVDGAGGELDDDAVIAVRSVAADGRSRAYLGGRSVPVGTLSEFAGPLLTVHGQNDQLRLLRPERQRDLLDAFAGSPATKALRAYQAVREEWLTARAELADRTTRSRELALEQDHLTASLAEIDGVEPVSGEDVDTVEKIKRLSDLDTLREAADTSYAALTGAGYGGDGEGAGAVLDLLGTVRAALSGSDDAVLRALAERVEEAATVAGDVATELGAYLTDLPSDPSELESLLLRQSELKTLTRKYAPDIDGVLAWADEARTRLEGIDTSAEGLAALQARVTSLEADLAAAAAALTAARVKAAGSLGKKVTGELRKLAMGGASITVDVAPDAVAPDADGAGVVVDGAPRRAGAHGTDVVEFRLVAHDGANPLPIGKSASGGELSRVMLALEVVLAATEQGLTMVFDEVDAGVGGKAAVEIGRRLAALAQRHQVIVVTHLPQVAAFADTHLTVGKQTGKGSVTSTLTALSREERIAELARMLAGLGDSDTGRAHAEELLEAADSDKVAQSGAHASR
ncbi:DNA repair protein RecN [Tsukamurella tyrosinosolvens]|uniref:DNA repair protein RecN n=1 Tax=Tsukamurella tyrosinosolvens TaxID=57704 RepID=UPI001AF46BF0|nr:DNA repair protein RecN [Tsukamurella tyrosinosolvens]QRY83545.1 DNA repair protein RecN [Tsukamurella tyrosinosolvens]